jgi:hypothetical protein
MKILILMSSILIMNSFLSAQIATTTESKDSTNIYFQAFSLFCHQKSEKMNTLLVEENIITTKGLPSICFGQKVEIVNIETLQHLLRREKQVQLIRIVPLRVKNDDFFVNIIVLNVSKKGKKVEFVNVGGLSVLFKYDCNLNSFVNSEIR